MVDEDDPILEKAIGLVFCILFFLYKLLSLCSSVSLHVCAWLTEHIVFAELTSIGILGRT
jgi:hypothetical protein